MTLASIGAGIGYFFFFLIMIVSLIIIIVGLPGTWVIMIEAIVFAIITRFDHGIGWWDLIALLAMAGVGEVLEFIITARGAQKYGGSNSAMAAAIIGGIIGAMVVNMFLPIIGALIGAFLGVYLGAVLVTYLFDRDFKKARQVGIGAFKGRLGAVLVKVSIGVAMASIIVWQIFF